MAKGKIVSYSFNIHTFVIHLVGAIMAAYCSLLLNQSIFWAGFHAVFGWFYILYLIIGFGGGLPPGFW